MHKKIQVEWDDGAPMRLCFMKGCEGLFGRNENMSGERWRSEVGGVKALFGSGCERSFFV